MHGPQAHHFAVVQWAGLSVGKLGKRGRHWRRGSWRICAPGCCYCLASSCVGPDTLGHVMPSPLPYQLQSTLGTPREASKTTTMVRLARDAIPPPQRLRNIWRRHIHSYMYRMLELFQEFQGWKSGVRGHGSTRHRSYNRNCIFKVVSESLWVSGDMGVGKPRRWGRGWAATRASEGRRRSSLRKACARLETRAATCDGGAT
eukprot:scaffold2020_cov188-Prasinococcus_capsulatus_cf.AAC.2